MFNSTFWTRAALPFALIVMASIWPAHAGAARYGYSSYERPALSESSLRKSLLRHYNRWEGTPYRFGGNSRYGVDCSGFVHIIFRDALGIEVPRSTELISRIRKRISKRNLQAGDIVLFKTSRTSLHTGVYIGNNQFIHASKSKGVILSQLNSPYWQSAYYKSVRVTNRST